MSKLQCPKCRNGRLKSMAPETLRILGMASAVCDNCHRQFEITTTNDTEVYG